MSSIEFWFLMGGVLLTIPIVWFLIHAVRELRKEPPMPPTPTDENVAPSAEKV